jgi:hypothetical protein
MVGPATTATCWNIQIKLATPARKKLVVRFQKPLPLLQLTANRFGIAPNQARHTLGFGFPALPHQKIPLPFFKLLPHFFTDHPTHNREVCGRKHDVQDIYNGIIELWKTHRPTMVGTWVTTHLLQSDGQLPVYSTLHAPVAKLDRITGFEPGGVPRGGHPLRISLGAPIFQTHRVIHR